MKRTLMMVCAALFAATMLEAAPPPGPGMPPGKWWRRPDVVKTLALTEDQQRRLDNIFADAADALIDAKAEAEKAQTALRRALDAPSLDRAAVQSAGNRLHVARGRLFERELMMLVDMRAVLSPQQWMTMRQHLDQHDDERRGPPRRH